jgi:hypothetical protein
MKDTGVKSRASHAGLDHDKELLEHDRRAARGATFPVRKIVPAGKARGQRGKRSLKQNRAATRFTVILPVVPGSSRFFPGARWENEAASSGGHRGHLPRV